jgi:shikimate dehydrogenase
VVDDDARLISSVNTVIPHAGGWRGTNTDVHGIVQALRQAGVRDPSAESDGVSRDAESDGVSRGAAARPAQRIAILGSGATARSAVAAAARMGAAELLVCARRRDAAEEVATLAVRFGLAAQVRDLVPAAEVMASDVVISALPGDVAAPWAALAPLASGVLLDASYHPWPTPLAAAWQGAGVASGRDMLLWQAVEQVRLMTGLEPPVGAMSAALPA